MDAEIAQTDDLRLVALPSAINCTDMFVRFTVGEWSLKPMTDEATRAATNLVRSVVDNSASPNPGLVSVRLRLHGNCLLIEVEDDEAVLPDAVSTGVEGARSGVVSPDERSRIAWCELALPGGMEATDVPLPRREPRRSQAAARQEQAEPATDFDPQVMQRLLSGLSGTGEGQ